MLEEAFSSDLESNENALWVVEMWFDLINLVICYLCVSEPEILES